MHAGLAAYGTIGQGYEMIRCVTVCTYENVNFSLTLDVMEGGLKLLFPSHVKLQFPTPEGKDLAC